MWCSEFIYLLNKRNCFKGEREKQKQKNLEQENFRAPVIKKKKKIVKINQ